MDSNAVLIYGKALYLVCRRCFEPMLPPSRFKTCEDCRGRYRFRVESRMSANQKRNVSAFGALVALENYLYGKKDNEPRTV